MKVLMFGWEFPPYKSGGLGTACYDLCKGLSRQGVEVTFVMPVAPKDADGTGKHCGQHMLRQVPGGRVGSSRRTWLRFRTKPRGAGK